MTATLPRGQHIGIVGSHSVGKTTFATDLATRLGELGIESRVVPEPIRQLSREGDTQLTFFLKLLNLHFERIAHTGALSIYDRTLLDFQVYLEVERLNLPMVLTLTQTLIPLYLGQFQHLFYLPIEFPMTPDDRRPINEPFRQQVDARINGYLQHLNVPVTRPGVTRHRRPRRNPIKGSVYFYAGRTHFSAFFQIKGSR
jgi:hypothetical protein